MKMTRRRGLAFVGVPRVLGLERLARIKSGKSLLVGYTTETQSIRPCLREDDIRNFQVSRLFAIT
jgi:hypothetical protein